MIDDIRFWIDLNSDLIKSTIFLFLICLLIVFLPCIPRYIRNPYDSEHDIQAKAIIQDIRTKKGISETQIGGKVVENTYEIDYIFEYEGEKYYNKEFIHRKLMKPSDRIQFRFLEIRDTIRVSFSSNNPKGAMLKLERF